MARLIILGPPGSGKGTQAEHIARHFAIPAISTGDLFRAHVKDKTDLGAEAGKYMDKGEFVPDRVTTEMLRLRLQDEDAGAGFLLDGYPRNAAQVLALDELLSPGRHAVDVVIALAVDDDELVSRMLRRAKEQGRSDDTESVIHRRLELYRDETHAVVAAYTERGLLLSVDGSGRPEEITAKVLAEVEAALHRGRG